MNEIETEFVPYNVAVELDKLGFNKSPVNWTEQYIYRNSRLCRANEGAVRMFKSLNDEIILAPTYRQAFKFFRDKYKLSSWIYNSDLDKYFFTVLQNGRIIKANQSTDSYEEAELECLNKLIKICKNEQ